MKGIRQETAPSSSPPTFARVTLLSAGFVCACLLATPARVAAQVLPASPITTAGGRLTVGAEAAAAVAPNDEAYFNYSAYGYDLLRQFRGDLSAQVTLDRRISLLGDVRVEAPIGEGQWDVRPYALFVRVHPWASRAFDVQAGLIPPVFGAFSRRSYGADNPLIGFPLAYQYLTTLRPDALPASADGLLALRGHGWLTAYPIGSLAPDHGVPLVDGLHYQTGVEMRAGNDPLQVSAAITSGTVSTPGANDWTVAPQVSGRVQWRHGPGLLLGVSASRGVFFSHSVTDALGPEARDSANAQRALGFDAEFSHGYWLIRSEAIWSSWRLPPVPSSAGQPPSIDTPLGAFAIDVEGRYRITPALYVAGRVGRLDFSRITGSAGPTTWDAPVRRAEVGGGYALQRNILAKVTYQYNWRDSSYEPVSHLVSAQLLFWF